MFVWDCHKTEGRSLGLCKLDTSIYGTCCYHNGTFNEIVVTDTPASSGEPDIDYQEGFHNVSVEISEGSQSQGPTSTTPEFYQCGVSELEGVPAVAAATVQKSRNSPEFRIVGGEPGDYNFGFWDFHWSLWHFQILTRFQFILKPRLGNGRGWCQSVELPFSATHPPTPAEGSSSMKIGL